MLHIEKDLCIVITLSLRGGEMVTFAIIETDFSQSIHFHRRHCARDEEMRSTGWSCGWFSGGGI